MLFLSQFWTLTVTPRNRRGLATWLTASSSPLFVLDERRVVVVFNQGCEQLTQWAADDIIGKSCHAQTIADPDLPATLTGVLAPPDQGASPSVSRVLIHRKDGTVLEQEIHFFPLHSAEQEVPSHVLGFFVDPSAGERVIAGRRLDVARHTVELYQRYRLDRFVAKSSALQRVATQIELARQSTVALHLAGAAGVGKEHLARLIHYGSPNRLQRFIPIRSAESTRQDIERTLNRLYDPDGGQEPATIYLDQIQKLAVPLQKKVLEQMEIGKFRHLSSAPAAIDQFSDEVILPELRWRLSALVITIPALVDRGDDLLLLAQQILEEQNQTSDHQIQGFTPAVERVFQQYNWPGNVEELGRVISLAVPQAVGRGALIDLPHLPPDFAEALTAQALRPRPVRRSLDDELEAFEKQRIEQALADARGNKSVAADLLQVPRAKLYRRLAHFGLFSDESTGAGGE